MIDNRAAVAHFRRHMERHPNSTLNRMGPWVGLGKEEREADIRTADWVPNRAMWRAQGFRNGTHALEVLGGE